MRPGRLGLHLPSYTSPPWSSHKTRSPLQWYTLLDVFTQTIPGPPPGAIGFCAAASAGLNRFVAEDPKQALSRRSRRRSLSSVYGVGICFGAVLAAGVGAGIAGAGAAGFAGTLPQASPSFAIYQVCTPLCPRQAPSFDAAVEYVPSLQIPFVPAGAPAGACAPAPREPAPREPASPSTNNPSIFTLILFSIFVGSLSRTS